MEAINPEGLAAGLSRIALMEPNVSSPSDSSSYASLYMLLSSSANSSSMFRGGGISNRMLGPVEVDVVGGGAVVLISRGSPSDSSSSFQPPGTKECRPLGSGFTACSSDVSTGTGDAGWMAMAGTSGAEGLFSTDVVKVFGSGTGVERVCKSISCDPVGTFESGPSYASLSPELLLM